MNTCTVSAECLYGMHSHCDYEDCACRCHLLDDDTDPEGHAMDYSDELEEVSR